MRTAPLFWRVASVAAAVLVLAACSTTPDNDRGVEAGVDAAAEAGNDSGAAGDSASDAHDAQADSASGPIDCAGLDGTLVMDLAWTLPSASGDTYNMMQYTCVCSGVGFPSKGALVVRFTTPSIAMPPTSGAGGIYLSEFLGPTAVRSGSLSTSPCDFTTGITGQAGESSVFAGGTSVSINFTLDYQKSGYLELQPSTTYYLNVENYYMGGFTCSNPSVCDVKVTLNPPPGT
jgi:hypothetical protein